MTCRALRTQLSASQTDQGSAHTNSRACARAHKFSRARTHTSAARGARHRGAASEGARMDARRGAHGRRARTFLSRERGGITREGQRAGRSSSVVVSHRGVPRSAVLTLLSPGGEERRGYVQRNGSFKENGPGCVWILLSLSLSL